MNRVITHKDLNTCLTRCPEILHFSLGHERDGGKQESLGAGFQQFCIVKLALYKFHARKE